MIVFEGAISKKTKAEYEKVMQKSTFWIIWLAILPILIGIVVFICVHRHPEDLIWLIAFGIPFICFIPNTKKYRQEMDRATFPLKVTMDDEIITAVGVSFEEESCLSSVKEIVDYGNWYQFIFYHPDKSDKFICEKCLIQGALSEFEERFEEFIVKKEPRGVFEIRSKRIK